MSVAGFGDKDGYVEQIGLRSTRIRALNGDLISIPNSKFSELDLINKSRQKAILLRQIIGLRYETSSEQLRFCANPIAVSTLSPPQAS